MQTFSPFARAALAVVRESGALFRFGPARSHTIRHKGRIDLVTETDLAVEAFLKERLAGLAPGASFLAEESATGLTSLSPQGPCWIIDPVDGTTNYAHGIPLCATSVAYYADGAVQLGIVNVPFLNECFVAERGRGAWLGEERLRVSEAVHCDEAVVATGFPYTIADEVDAILTRMRPVLANCQGVRRCGAAAMDLAWVAAGRFDAYYEADLKPWDAAAGWLLVTEAGGRVTAMDGTPFRLGGPLLSSNGVLHGTMLKLLQG